MYFCMQQQQFKSRMEKYKFGVKFRLEQRRENPKDKESKLIKSNLPINADITFNGKRIFFFTGYRIDADKWVDKVVGGVRVQEVKKNNFNLKGESASEINAKLRRIRIAVEDVFRRLAVNEVPPTTNNVRDELKKELDEETMSRKTLIEYYRQFVEEESVASTWAKGTITKHNTIIAHLQNYKKQLYFEDITEDVLNGFVRYLITEKGLSNTYIAKLIKDVKWFLNWAAKKGYNRTIAYKDFNPKLKGVSTSDKTNIIALSVDEFLHLYHLDIKAPHLQRVRDVFCFCCTTSLRYSDVRNLKWSNVKADRIEIVTIKTDDSLVIPLNELSQGIIDKYAHLKDVSEYVLPVISNQRYNDYLKELGKLAGFDQPQSKVIYRGSERIETTTPKYEILTSHVARKTFVTIGLYLGIPAEMIRSFTGHKDPKVMERYLKFNMTMKNKLMQKFNIESPVTENVFDFDITDEECTTLGIPEKVDYLAYVAKERDLGTLHLAFLFQRRGDTLKALEYVGKLPDTMKVQFMQTITNGLPLNKSI